MTESEVREYLNELKEKPASSYHNTFPRNGKIVELWLTGLTYEAVGQHIKDDNGGKPLSRERVRQIINWAYDGQIPDAIRRERPQRTLIHTVYCAHCDKELIVKNRLFKKTKIFACSREHRHIVMYGRPGKRPKEEERERQRLVAHLYYQKHKDDPAFKEKIRKYNLRARLKAKGY